MKHTSFRSRRALVAALLFSVLPPARAHAAGANAKLPELWRITDSTFGVIRDIASDGQGNVYLLDSQRCVVRVYSSTGKFLRLIGHEGEGPGEFRHPVSMFVGEQGDVGVVQMIPGKVVYLSSDGKPTGDITPAQPTDATSQLVDGDARGGNVVLLFDSRKFDETHKKWSRDCFLASVTTDGKVVARYATKETAIDLTAPLLDDAEWDTFEQRWQIGPDGRVYAANSYDKYEISVYDEAGKLQKVIAREGKPVTRSAHEKDVASRTLAFYSKMIPNCKTRVHDTARGIENFYVRDDGSVWVLSAAGARNLPAGTLGVFDVFNPELDFVKTVALEGEGNPLEDRYVFDRNRLYVITGFLNGTMREQGIDGTDDSPTGVICYKLEGDALAAKSR